MKVDSRLNRIAVRVAAYQDEGFVGNFWGTRGSGLLLTTGTKILLLKRSGSVEQPGTWGLPGGAVPVDEEGYKNFLGSALDEAEEEMGGLPKGKVVGKTVFKKDGFEYYTFIYLVSEERAERFKPRLNWENDSYNWFGQDELPSNLHFGVKYTLQHSNPFIEEQK